MTNTPNGVIIKIIIWEILIERRRVMNVSAAMMMTGMRMCAMCTCVMQFFVTSTPEKNTAA